MKRKKPTLVCQSCANTFIQITLITYVKKMGHFRSNMQMKGKDIQFIYSVIIFA